MSHHKPKRQRGFTLIETLAAILVLTIGLVGLAKGASISSEDTRAWNQKEKCRGASLRGQGTPALSCPPPQ
jgi:prepilin-type N-terminal cleavage/methylation domain-containing protein